MTTEEVARKILKVYCGHPQWCYQHDEAIVEAITAALQSVRKEEREACAKVAEEREWNLGGMEPLGAIASAIRSRGQT